MVSFIELSVLSNEIGNVLDTNNKYREIELAMSDALSMHNNAFIQLTAFGNSAYSRQCDEAIKRLNTAIAEIEELKEIAAAAAELQAIVNSYVNSEDTAIEAYEKYQPVYKKMVAQIESYHTMTQNALSPSAVQLQNNAYRAVIPVFLSLVVMIAFVLMLFYFMIIYCVNPILAINSSLKSYIEFKVPFAPKSQNRDELQEICERIEVLTQQNKKLLKEE